MAKPRHAVPLTRKRKLRADEEGGTIYYGTPLTHPVAVEERYRVTLERLISQMREASERTVAGIWETHAPAVDTGMDAGGPSMASQARILTNALKAKFFAVFDTLAPTIADRVVKGVNAHSKSNLHSSLSDLSGGLSLKTSVIDGRVREIVKAATVENIGLIKSIPRQYFLDLQGAVMRSITTGQGTKTVMDAVKRTGAVADRRAALIARDQTSKATTALNSARMQALGVTEFEWLHSAGGLHPRPLHKNTLDGNIYSLANPPVIDDKTGERGLPGQLINCFVGSTEVSLANGCRNLWRYWHEGQIVQLRVEGGSLIECTGNHPILTARGWVPADEIQEGDYLAARDDQREGVVNSDNAERISFADLYVALVAAGERRYAATGAEFNFHGDVPKGDVDCVSPMQPLAFRVKAGVLQDVEKFDFATADGGALPVEFAGSGEVFHTLRAGVSGEGLPFLDRELREPNAISAGLVTDIDAGIFQNSEDHVARATVCFSELEDAHAGFVEQGDSGALPPRNLGRGRVTGDHASGLESEGHSPSGTPRASGEALDGLALAQGFRRVEQKTVRIFAGHVYTMETDVGWYQVSSANIVSKNCRCVALPVIKFGRRND